MGVDDLEREVQALRDRCGGLSDDQARLKESNASLEGRVRALERRLLEQPERALLGLPVQEVGGEPPRVSVAPESGDEESQQVEVAHAAEVEAEPKADLAMVEHEIGETLWDMVVFVGLPELPRSGSVILLASMLINFALQFFICVVLLTSETRRPFADLVSPMREFRMSTGHDHTQVDAKGRSLMSRICNADATLALGVKHSNLLAEINAYLGMGPEEVEQKQLGTGPLLCGFCVLLFATTVLRELRGVAASTWTMSAVPLGDRTVLEGGRLVALGRGRFVCIMVNNALRTGIAAMLLLTGVLWLASTRSITDLILNAAALDFVMDMDECIFEAMVPSSVHMFVKGLEALQYKRGKWNSEAVVPILAVCAITVMVFPFLVGPNAHDMVQVKQALCGGNTDFMVAKNSLGMVISSSTTGFSVAHQPGILERAVEEMTFQKGSGQVMPQLSRYSFSAMDFQTYVQDTFTTRGLRSGCIDSDTALGGYFLANSPYLFHALRYATGLHAGQSLAERPFACSDYAGFCQNEPLMRSMCPITCGCHDVFSGLVSTAAQHGCPTECGRMRRQQLESQPCVDMSVANTSAWRSYWTVLVQRLTATSRDPAAVMEVEAFAAKKIIEGCSNNDVFPVTNASDCDDSQMVEAFAAKKIIEGCSNNDVFPVTNASDCDDSQMALRGNGFAAVSAICAHRCCRGAVNPTECPTSCNASESPTSR